MRYLEGWWTKTYHPKETGTDSCYRMTFLNLPVFESPGLYLVS